MSVAPLPNPVLSEGRRAPAFRLVAHDGKEVRLTELRGRWVVLFFYPRLQRVSSGGTACLFQARMAEFRRRSTAVIGIGVDEVDTQRAFARANQIAFPLLADRNARVARRYGAWREKSSNGQAYVGIVRSTFLIDPSGRIERIFDNQRMKGHADKVLRALRQACPR